MPCCDVHVPGDRRKPPITRPSGSHGVAGAKCDLLADLLAHAHHNMAWHGMAFAQHSMCTAWHGMAWLTADLLSQTADHKADPLSFFPSSLFAECLSRLLPNNNALHPFCGLDAALVASN
jgi:hypothetical protein